MRVTTWDDLLLDTVVTPEAVDDRRFRQWMSEQRVFVSSTMDAEMRPYREAAREYLARFGTNVPVMWETISPIDSRPVQAFLDGVDRSSLFLLMLGKRYGAADDTGYSPTHKEAERAKARHLHRMLFIVSSSQSERDGKLNDWLKTLYSAVAGNEVQQPEDLVARLEHRLKDLAARAQRNWIKLGRCVFPGRVEMSCDGQMGRSFRVLARARDNRVRRALASMGARHEGELRLTWPNESFPVRIDRVQQMSEFLTEADIEISCRTPQNWYGDAPPMMTINNLGPAELTEAWASYAIFGKAVPTGDWRDNFALAGVKPDVTPLPTILKACGASGWQAEGLVRVYAIEETARVRGGHFADLSVGPATATEVPVEGEIQLDTFGGPPASVRLSGVVPLQARV